MTSEIETSASETFDDTEHGRIDSFTAFRDMEQELEALMRKYLIPTNDLKRLLEVWWYSLLGAGTSVTS